jgi:hypothetical protein
MQEQKKNSSYDFLYADTATNGLGKFSTPTPGLIDTNPTENEQKTSIRSNVFIPNDEFQKNSQNWLPTIQGLHLQDVSSHGKKHPTSEIIW